MKSGYNRGLMKILHGRRYLPLVATLGLFILVSNLLGLLPGFAAPTGNLNTTAACALIVFVAYPVIGVPKVGIGPYIKHFAGPLLGAELFPNKAVDLAFKAVLIPLFFVIEIFSHLARPLSLALRLFGNMAGGHILLAVMFLLTIGMIGCISGIVERISAPLVVCSCMIANSWAVSRPGLRRIASSMPILPMSWSGPPILTSSSWSSGSSSFSPSMTAYRVTRCVWLPV